MGRMDVRAAVITGAAGGIGWATTNRYTEEGAKVIAADRDTERGQALIDDVGPGVNMERGGQVHR